MADKDYKFLTDSGLGRLIKSAADKDFGFEGIYDPKNIGSAIYDLGAVPINKASEFLTGYNPGLSGSKFFKRRDDAGNLIDQDVAYADFLREQAYPKEQLEFLSGMIQGTPTGGYRPSSPEIYDEPSNFDKFMGYATGAIGLYGQGVDNEWWEAFG